MQLFFSLRELPVTTTRLDSIQLGQVRTMALPKPAETMALYGLTLMICGALAFQAAGATAKAKSALIVGNFGAVLSFILAGGIGTTIPKKGAPGYKMYMACVHIALVYPVILGSALAWRLWLAWHKPMRNYLLVMVTASILTAALVALNKPKNGKAAARAKTVAKAAKATQDAKSE